MTRKQRGFTLIELLLVISIIGILAGISITVTRQVYHTARVAKTETTIWKIDQVLMEMYAGFENRRVPSPNFGNSEVAAQVTQAARLWFLRDMMRMEMPCSWEEVIADPVQMKFQYGSNPTDITSQWVRVDDSPLRQLYLKTYNDALARSKSIETVHRYAPAKCLFLVVMYGNPEARELFVDSEIATDDDGLSYFVDGWGHPIYFLRWAPGFVLSERQPHVLASNRNSRNWNDDSIIAAKDKESHSRPDPLDPTEVGGILSLSLTGTGLTLTNQWVIDLTQKWSDDSPRRGWALLPVVMSSGGAWHEYELRFSFLNDLNFGIVLRPYQNQPPASPSDPVPKNIDSSSDRRASDSYIDNYYHTIRVPMTDPFLWGVGAPLASQDNVGNNFAIPNHAIIHNHNARR